MLAYAKMRAAKKSFQLCFRLSQRGERRKP